MTAMKTTRQKSLTSEELQECWDGYLNNGSQEDKHRLLMQYIGLVRYVLHNINLPPNAVLGDEDFVQIGILGLHEAMERYEADRGVKFETYAIPRIRGKILDEVRRSDWLSRTARKRSQDFLQAADRLRSEYGREVSSEEIRRKLKLSADEYKVYLRAAAAATSYMSLGDAPAGDQSEDGIGNPLENVADDTEVSALDKITDEEQVTFITTYLEKLPERQRLIMTLYYYKSLTFREIGQLLKITESRVCQIHTQIVGDLRKKIKAL